MVLLLVFMQLTRDLFAIAKFLLSKFVGMWKIFWQKTDKTISYQNLEKTNTVKVANDQFDKTYCDDWSKMCCFYVVFSFTM